MTSLAEIAPAFVAMAHRIVWCTAATVGTDGRPRTRVLHPLWAWDGTALTGWVLTSPRSPKAADLAAVPSVSLTYWSPDQDTCTADGEVSWDEGEQARREGWERFASGPAPVGYDPAIIPGWTDPAAPDFGVLRIAPTRLRVMPGSVLLAGRGEVLRWRQG